MKKQVIVSVDRGETRVALLEATGTPAAGAATKTSEIDSAITVPSSAKCRHDVPATNSTASATAT